MGTILFPGSLSPEQKREEKRGSTERACWRQDSHSGNPQYICRYSWKPPFNVGLLSLVLPHVLRAPHRKHRGGPNHAGPLSFDSEDEICRLERMCRTASWIYVIIPLLSYLCVEILFPPVVMSYLQSSVSHWSKSSSSGLQKLRFFNSGRSWSGTFSLCEQTEAQEPWRWGRSKKKDTATRCARPPTPLIRWFCF